MATVELGGNISLTGFEDIQPVQMVVLKKIVGNSVKTYSEKAKDFQKFELILSKEGDQHKLKAILTAEKPVEAESISNNLFMALADVLKKIESSLE